tara:strand:+ start:172 stop:1446 length:1275 start_codon:yes stop_codon:yes gene_type:complete
MPYIGAGIQRFNTADNLTVTGTSELKNDVTVTGDVTASGTVLPTGDTAAGDAAAVGFTSAEGLILTGQGSTSDITLKNDADAIVFSVPTGTDDILFPDNAKAIFGAGSDLELSHNGTDSIIEGKTGDLILRTAGTESIFLQDAGGNNLAQFNDNNDVKLYHNANEKLATTSGGVSVTGVVFTNTVGRVDDTNTTIDFPGSDVIQFFTAGNERGRFDASGRFMVGSTDANSAHLTSTTNATNEFAADLRSISSSYTSIVCLIGSNTNTTNSTYDHLRCDIHGQAQKLAIRDSGNVVNANNSYGSLSDSRMKENIVDAASQWDDIKALQVRKYNRIGDTQKELGVIAQELEASGMGGLVEEGRYYDVNNNPDEETRKSVKYSVLYMKAIKALQEAMTRIETLETENATQATQIADLITRVTALEDA